MNWLKQLASLTCKEWFVIFLLVAALSLVGLYVSYESFPGSVNAVVTTLLSPIAAIALVGAGITGFILWQRSN